jgi:hypothetical protein
MLRKKKKFKLGQEIKKMQYENFVLQIENIKLI